VAFFVDIHILRKDRKKPYIAKPLRKKAFWMRLKLARIYRWYIFAPKPCDRWVFAATENTESFSPRHELQITELWPDEAGIWSINRVRVSTSGTLRRFSAMFYEQSCVIATVARTVFPSHNVRTT